MIVQRCPECRRMVPVVRDLGGSGSWIRIRAWRMARHRTRPVPSNVARLGYCMPLVLTPLGDREVEL